MTAEKTYQPSASRQQAGSAAFFRKAEGEGFFGHQEQSQQHFFSSNSIQPKLSISQPDDPQEKEADAMADQVMRMPEASALASTDSSNEEESVMRMPDAVGLPITNPEQKEEINRKEEEDETDITPSINPQLMRQCQNCDKEEGIQARLMRSSVDKEKEVDAGDATISRMAHNSNYLHPNAHAPPSTRIHRSGRAPPVSHSNFESTLQSTKGTGSPMPANTQASMEHRFGADFSDVRIHSNATAQNLSTDIQAHAFTHGGDIYFNSGKYAPHTSEGGHLLAHELTHTIQQGASSTVSTKSAVSKKSISRSARIQKRQSAFIQRVAAERPAPSQLTNAVNHAKAEAGLVNSGKEGPDGFRMGWPRLVEYFQTTMGKDKVMPTGGTYVKGAIGEQDIKKKRLTTGLPPAHPAMEHGAGYKRDAMPSWCGIFVYWALHKAGVPMKPWLLGGRNIPPEAAFSPSHTPQVGDIAYRNDFSHFAIVEKTTGDTVTTVNGNTAGEDNLGGQVQTRDHPRSGWTAFFDPLMLKDGPLSAGETTAEAVRPLGMDELREKVFRKENENEEGLAYADGGRNEVVGIDTEAHIQTKPELSNYNVNAKGIIHREALPQADGEQLQKKESEKEEEKIGGQHVPTLQKKSEAVYQLNTATSSEDYAASGVTSSKSQNQKIATTAASSQATLISPQLQYNKGPPSLQRSWYGDAWDAVGDAVSGAIEWAEDQINEAKAWILEQASDFVSHIPGFKLLTIILQRNPITGRAVVRTGASMLDAGLDILPLGNLFRQVLIRTGAYQDAANFVAGRVDDFANLASSIGTQFSGFIDRLSISDIGHPQRVLEDVASLFQNVVTQIVGFITRSAEDFLTMIKNIMIRLVVSFVRNQIPRLYPFLRVALGYDPITNEVVPRNGSNILNALFEVTDAGREQRRQLQESGTFQKVADWIDRGIGVFSRMYEAIRTGFSMIWDVISIETLFAPTEAFERIYNHFAVPVSDLWNFIRDTALVIIQFIKEALLSRLSTWARDQRGYFLITLLIRKDPFTGKAVPFTVENVIHAFMSLMDGGEAQFQQMKESGAIARTTDRIHAAVRRLGFTVEYIVALFTGLWNSLTLSSLANIPSLFIRVINTFAQPVRRLLAFVVEIIKIVVEVIMQIMEFPSDLIGNILRRAMQAWEHIKSDPIGFLKNLLRAIKQGFIQFFDNILDHLMFGLTGWLMAELRDAGVPAMTDFSLRGIITWVLAVLNISMEAIWAKLAAHPRIGPERVARIRSMIGRLEGIWTFIRDVQERGMEAIWEKIQEQLTNLWDTILDSVKNWIMEQIINRITARLLSMLDPTGIMAVVNSAIALYSAIQSFIRYLRQILEVINSFVMGLADIAAGNISTAANYLENTMRRAMPVVIGFLANQVGLGGVGHRIAEMIGRARDMVDRALTWLVNRAVDTGFAIFDRLLSMGRSAVAGIRKFLGLDKPFTARDGSTHHIYYDETGARPQLMVASGTPSPISSLLARIHTQATASTDPAVQTAYTNAVAHNANIHNYETQLNAMPETPSPARQAVYNNLSSAMQSIVPDLEILMAVTSGPTPPEATLPAFTGGVVSNGFEALYVSTTTTGGQPASANNGSTLPGWHDLTIHSDPTDPTKSIRERDNYVKMHLLHDQLGGKATDSNLAPVMSTYNTAFYNQVENFAVADKPTKVMWYNVQINHHPSAGSGPNAVSGINYSAYPSRFIGKYGYMEFNAATNNWMKSNNGAHHKAYASPALPIPDFSGGGREYEMNAIAETTISTMTDGSVMMPPSYAAIIAMERRDAHDTGRHRKYSSFPDLERRLTERQQIRPSSGFVVGFGILQFLKNEGKLKFH